MTFRQPHAGVSRTRSIGRRSVPERRTVNIYSNLAYVQEGVSIRKIRILCIMRRNPVLGGVYGTRTS
jgi:hypothetical protein